MKHRRFFLLFLAIMALLFTGVGLMALFDYPGAEVIFWSREPVESRSGKLLWVTISAACFMVATYLLLTDNDR